MTDNIRPLLHAEGLAKHYGSIHALRDATFSVGHGEVVGLVGDNGAGKSTLLKTLAGALQPTTGRLLIEGEPVEFHRPRDAQRAGIETVYQDLALASNLSVAENLYFGRERLRPGLLGRLGVLDHRAAEDQARAELDKIKIRIPSVASQCGELSGGQRQAVAVARAAAFGSKLVLMDEPTAALGVEQQHQVGELITRIRSQGTSVLLVSHNLPQVHELCDRVIVLYRGTTVADLAPGDVSIEEIIAWITGAAVPRGRGA
ncbi:MAG: monosaccharide transporter ATP-binding protein family [Naasia sp.]|jgi:simple sugar transport system ATP-binding protein|uniref:ATP-binding cassette domain-containing protein n=1 Tax=Naasia sp. TaxID=2546198 RepID=UPI002638427F|nr:ATP-binding cassette domain-containing protein [Naasia sp.]MCU1570823.1 monosaccharide transporter ATP-binding protein family [Naasia sp.]